MGVVPTRPNSRVWLDHRDLSGFVNAGEFGLQNEVMDAAAFNTSGPKQVVGNFEHTHSHGVLWDGGTSDNSSNDIDAFLHGLAGSSDGLHYLGETWGANAAGSVAYESIVKLESKPHKGTNGQLQMFQLAMAGSGQLSRGLVLANATATGTTNYTGRNQGVTASTQTYQAVVRVLGGTFTSFTLQIQQSSDDGSGDAYALITGMTVSPSAVGVTRLTFTGVTEAWKRAAITAWTGTNAIIIVTGGVVTQ